jgi:endonuclease/exonuclease/phosphatase family metal-dependent hydrolase
MHSTPNMTMVSLNIGGIPQPRYAHARTEAFCRLVADMDADVINLQEVHGYGLLWRLRARLRSFPFVSFKPGVVGPKAGLVTFSKLPVEKTGFFSMLAATRSIENSRLPAQAIPQSRHKGILVTRLGGNGLITMNVHLNPNKDGDWSSENRFHPVHKAQLDAVNEFAARPAFANSTVIVSGDFNLAKDCDLYAPFLAQGRWTDIFEGDFTPTFNVEFLSPGMTPHRIDYLLLRDPLGTFDGHEASVLFTDKVRLGNNQLAYISDHIGLRGRFSADTPRSR